jgi:hypothetical protein
VQQAITSRLDPDTVLQMIADEARRLTNTAMSAVYLLEGEDLVISVISGDVSPKMLGHVVPMHNSVAGMAFKSRKPFGYRFRPGRKGISLPRSEGRCEIVPDCAACVGRSNIGVIHRLE